MDLWWFSDTEWIISGSLFAIASVCILIRGEYFLIQPRRVFNQIQKECVSIELNPESDSIDLSKYCGRLVHITGNLVVPPSYELHDRELNISFSNAIQLTRHVAMFQWQQLPSPSSSSSSTSSPSPTSSNSSVMYITDWSSQPISSSNFFDPSSQHQNPAFPYPPYTHLCVSALTLSPYSLTVPSALISSSCTWYSNRPLSSVDISCIWHDPHDKFMKNEGLYLYMGRGPPLAPHVGDISIRYREVPCTYVSIIASIDQNNVIVPFRFQKKKCEKLDENTHLLINHTRDCTACPSTSSKEGHPSHVDVCVNMNGFDDKQSEGQLHESVEGCMNGMKRDCRDVSDGDGENDVHSNSNTRKSLLVELALSTNRAETQKKRAGIHEELWLLEQGHVESQDMLKKMLYLGPMCGLEVTIYRLFAGAFMLLASWLLSHASIFSVLIQAHASSTFAIVLVFGILLLFVTWCVCWSFAWRTRITC